MASLNVVRVDFAQARALRASGSRGGWTNLRAASPGIVPSLKAPSRLAPILTRILARYCARRASAVERILRKGIAALE
jgi:hypothetical protein